ncbi:MAG TPA: CPXCG motif-containing cysteine-rich protein [Chthoniobacteraceae bacterium]|jgi:hypothetical protein
MALIIETDVGCPWCGEFYSTTIDTSQGDHSTIEDCAVCCRPITLSVSCEPGELISVDSAQG